jgi:murein DD-endopeptidase MepM/ murein hydrolase activator NlpD
MIGPEFKEKSQYKNWIKRLVFLGIFSFFLFGFVFFFLFNPKPIKSPEPEKSTEPESQYQIVEGVIKPRTSLYQSLREKNIPHSWIDIIVSKLKPFLNFRELRGGAYRLLTTLKGEFLEFIFEKSPKEIFKIEKKEGEYIVQKEEVLLHRELVRVSGEIRSSLYEAMKAAGEEDILTLSFADILAWEIDFYQDLREGDRFQLVVEKLYREGQFVQYGPILALEYQNENRRIRGFLYKNSYYNEQGLALRKPFLKAPLRFDRISSRFSHARRHPILGGIRPHFGVDYAAPEGTPVWAVADGKVVFVGEREGYGKSVILQHRNGYQTYYGHLSRYGPGIRKGKRVSQKEIIGYVGSTGLATGPHLDYRVSKDGQFLNPLKVFFPPGIPLKKEELGEFFKKRDEMLAWFL